MGCVRSLVGSSLCGGQYQFTLSRVSIPLTASTPSPSQSTNNAYICAPLGCVTATSIVCVVFGRLRCWCSLDRQTVLTVSHDN